MKDYPASALNLATYFEDTYIGERLLDQSRRVPQFRIRIWNMYESVQEELARTNNVVEAWHNGFQTSIACSHPTISIFLNDYRESSRFRKQHNEVGGWPEENCQ
ncbi:hypothetical protein LOD99_9355 [Oopsacas minuta]|uniref:Uncharacterized protein n=1 Tax=Oopsacas minuta TaxID=111878 RepID=A0AAV7JBU1_9METZ|nr:hypothetical protein LOD99_9355 [Oopsacas minuta]